jgi:hypothetical protein
LDFKEELRRLKIFFNVFSNEQLAEKLNLSRQAINEWTRRKTIPKRYLKLLEQENINQNINNQTNGNNSVQINGNNTGQIHINSSDEMSMAICQEVKKLNDKEKEYYYHLIKADVLRKNLKGDL